MQGSGIPPVPRKEETYNYIKVKQDLRADQHQNDINDLIAEMNKNCQFEDKMSELSGTLSDPLQNFGERVTKDFKHDFGLDPMASSGVPMPATIESSESK